MIELTIKTLDAQNHHFTVPNDYTVEQLKEHIADTIQIPSESQRCIYLGQVLQNETKLTDCDVNGKVIHVVQRPPPSSAYSTLNDAPPAAGPMPGRRQETHTGTMYVGAMAFPADFVDAGGLTFLHPLHQRTNASMSRLAVARNLLRRTATIINQLESENYFNSSSEQNNQFLGFAGNNLSDDITGADAAGGLDQPEVEIRVESPNSHDNASENVSANVDNDLPESAASNGASANPDNDDSLNADTSNNQNTNGASRPSEANRRRSLSRTSMMATVMGAVLHAQIRLIPFMRLLRQYLIQDTTFGPDSQTTHTEQQVQSLYNSVSELMHYFAHIYHSLSDVICDFSQPPPRTLRCRPVILQQQHATVLRSGPRARPLIRSPLVAVARSAPSTNSTASDTSANSNPPNATTTTTSGGESNGTENDSLNRDLGASAVEVVIEEADTTNLQDNTDDGTPENMDLGESTEEGSANGGASGGAPTVTMRARGGNTFVIQSMPSLPDGVLPDGIRINSVEATILAPNDDLAAAFGGGSNNQRVRAGILPAEALQNMLGLVNLLRSTQRQQQQQQRATTNGERPRQPNAENGTDAGQQPNNASENNQSSSSPHERLEFDITAGVSRTLFDPFLPCHSHHIHPTARSTNARGTTQNTGTQASSNQSGQSTQTQSGATQTAATDDQQQSTAASESATNETAGQQSANRNEADGGISIPEVTRNVASFINNIFPGLNIGNLMVRRGGSDPTNPPAEGATNVGADGNTQGRQSARARIQVTSNLNSIFPGAIQIEIDPMTNDLQANVVPNNSTPSHENRPRLRRRPFGSSADPMRSGVLRSRALSPDLDMSDHDASDRDLPEPRAPSPSHIAYQRFPSPPPLAPMAPLTGRVSEEIRALRRDLECQWEQNRVERESLRERNRAERDRLRERLQHGRSPRQVIDRGGPEMRNVTESPRRHRIQRERFMERLRAYDVQPVPEMRRHERRRVDLGRAEHERGLRNRMLMSLVQRGLSRPYEYRRSQSSMSPSLLSNENGVDVSGSETEESKNEKYGNKYLPSKAVMNLYFMIYSKGYRSPLTGKSPFDSKKDTATNYPLYQDNQEGLFLDIVNSAIRNISLEQLTRGSEDTVASSVCRNIRDYLSTQPNVFSSIKEDLLNVVNVLVNNDLYKMKNLLDNDCVKQEIDMVSTICKLNQDSIPELIECIINCEDLTEAEIKKFYQIFKFYVACLLRLFVHCVVGDSKPDKTRNIRKVLIPVVEEILKGLPKNDVLADWLRKDLIEHAASYMKVCHRDDLPAFMEAYVVYRLPPIMPVKCTVATALTSVGNNNNATTSQQPQPMEVEEAAQSSSSNSSETSFVSANSEENRAVDETAAQVTSNPPSNSSTSTEPVPEVTLNSEEWHRSFPTDWVPIIARDIHRLRRQGSQPPYSDAYLSGMPTKRRKLIKNSKPNVNSNEQLINGNITSAIDSAGLSASLNSVSNQIASETSVSSNAESLSTIVKAELQENVRENIVQQTDFIASRFPESAAYFVDN